MQLDRRRHSRLQYRGAAYFTAEKPSVPLGTIGVAELRDISIGGLSWSTDILLAVGDRVALTIDLMTSDEPVGLQGEVMWVVGDWSGVRLQYPNLTYRAAIRRLMVESRALDIRHWQQGAVYEPTIMSVAKVTKLEEDDED
jgi:hypothetical protein